MAFAARPRAGATPPNTSSIEYPCAFASLVSCARTLVTAGRLATMVCCFFAFLIRAPSSLADRPLRSMLIYYSAIY
ncbi:hypothetical protein D3C71_2104310 [compost metagenome]